MHSTTEDVQLPISLPPASLTIVDWPIRNGGYRAWLFSLAAVVSAAALGWWSGGIGFATIGALAIGLAMWRMWIPVQFEFSPKGVTYSVLRRARRIPWSAIYKCRLCRDGVLLLPNSDEAPLTTLQGTYLRWCGHRDEIVAITRYYLGDRVV